MIIKGKYAEAKVFATLIDQKAIESIERICNLPYMEGASISIMPDTGYVSDYCVTGYVQKGGKINVDCVSADIACSIKVYKLDAKEIDLEKFDRVVKEVNESKDRSDAEFDFSDLTFKVDEKRISMSYGLGNGNHYIELDKDDEGSIYLTVHSGSRNLGGQIFKHYQELAYKKCNSFKDEKEALIKKLKEEGREREIQTELQKINRPEIKKEVCWIEGEDLKNYIHDCQVAAKFSEYNKDYLVSKILDRMSIKVISSFQSVHNYIDEEGVIRKGAISAKKGELIYVALSMKEGGLICEALGNEDYLLSAPHGAGRVYSRKEAKQKVSLEEFKESMKGIYSSCISEEYIDEAPSAYKKLEDIEEMLRGTAKILKHIKPIYNYKEASKEPWLK